MILYKNGMQTRTISAWHVKWEKIPKVEDRLICDIQPGEYLMVLDEQNENGLKLFLLRNGAIAYVHAKNLERV